MRGYWRSVVALIGMAGLVGGLQSDGFLSWVSCLFGGFIVGVCMSATSNDIDRSYHLGYRNGFDEARYLDRKIDTLVMVHHKSNHPS